MPQAILASLHPLSETAARALAAANRARSASGGSVHADAGGGRSVNPETPVKEVLGLVERAGCILLKRHVQLFGRHGPDAGQVLINASGVASQVIHVEMPRARRISASETAERLRPTASATCCIVIVS